MKRGSSLRFIRWPMPQTFSGVVTRGWSVVSTRAEAPSGGADMLCVRSFRIGMLALPQLLGRVLHGFHDLVVAGAAAQVARDAAPDLVVGRALVLGQRRRGRHEHSGSTEAALQAVLLPETLLQRVELAAVGQALHRTEVRAVGLDGED